MGRQKISIVSISSERQKTVTFSRRRAGLIKKAHELSVLCDNKVALLIYDNRGQCHLYSSVQPPDTLLLKYQDLLHSKPVDAEPSSPSSSKSSTIPGLVKYSVETYGNKSEDIRIVSDKPNADGHYSVADGQFSEYSEYPSPLSAGYYPTFHQNQPMWLHHPHQYQPEYQNAEYQAEDPPVEYQPAFPPQEYSLAPVQGYQDYSPIESHGDKLQESSSSYGYSYTQ